MSKANYAITALLAAAVGLGTGAAVMHMTAPEPEVITETVTETVTDTEYIVPASCLAAIAEAREVFRIVTEVMDVAVYAIESAYYGDMYGVDAANADMEAINAEMEYVDFVAQAESCEGAA